MRKGLGELEKNVVLIYFLQSIPQLQDDKATKVVLTSPALVQRAASLKRRMSYHKATSHKIIGDYNNMHNMFKNIKSFY